VQKLPKCTAISVWHHTSCPWRTLCDLNVPSCLCSLRVHAAKELHFNRDGSALKRMQQGVDKLAAVVGVTLGPKGRNVVLESKFGSPKIVNDGVTVAKEVELEDPVENIGSKLVRQAAQKTNDSAGDGTTTATVLSAALIAEGMKVVVAGANPVQVTRGMGRTIDRLVKELKTMSQACTMHAVVGLIALIAPAPRRQRGFVWVAYLLTDSEDGGSAVLSPLSPASCRIFLIRPHIPCMQDSSQARAGP
jgi:hypothetical protein